MSAADTPVIRPYGSWTSPIGVQDVIAAGASMRELVADDGVLWWLETIPDQDGRATVMRLLPDGVAQEVTPTANVRSRVNEYGGGAYDVRDGVLVYCDHADHSVKLRLSDGSVQLLTAPDAAVRYGDLRVYPAARVVLAIREDHRVGAEPETTLVALSFPDARGNPGIETVVQRGADFYANPALSSQGRLAWLEWNHPAMPWDSTLLKIGQLSPLDSGGWLVKDQELILGDPDAEFEGIAIHHPRWNDDGSLIFTSEQGGFFQLCEWSPRGLRYLTEGTSDHDLPIFVLGNHATAALDDDRILTWRLDEGFCYLEIVSRNGESAQRLAGVSSVDSLASTLGRGYAIVDRPRDHTALVRIEGDGSLEVLRSLGTSPCHAVTSVPRSLVFDGRTGQVQAWYYPPTNDAFRGPAGTHPPAVLRVHGGPTAMATNGYYATVQFWTSRGIAVLDVNYSGSAGFGRAWRERLRGAWGVADVIDCVDAADAAIDAGLIDPGRIAIAGGSAGGFTALRALMDSDRFAAGIVRYGVTDLTALVGGHKFESHYLDSLVGPWPEKAARYEARSPINTLDQLDSPILILQGSEDPVVPMAQSIALADAARKRGLPMAIRIFEGEGHGFRSSAARRDALAAELSFLSQIFGFTPTDDLPELVIEGLPGR